MTLSDEILAPGWEWRGPNKVKKGRKHYIRAEGGNVKYVGVGRGDYTVKCPGGAPRFKLAALTHYDEELQALIREHKRQQRENLNNL